MVMVIKFHNIIIIGELGHRCSGDIKSYLTSYYTNQHMYSEEKSLITENLIYEKLVENNNDRLTKSYENAEKHLVNQKYDTFFSGSTGCMVVILGN